MVPIDLRMSFLCKLCLLFINFQNNCQLLEGKKSSMEKGKQTDKSHKKELNHWLCCGFLLTNKKFKVATEVVSFEVNGLKKLLMGIGFLLLN